MKVSVIVTTYNWPEALTAVLASLFEQRDKCDEVIVGDDGSTEETAHLLSSWAMKWPAVKHAWQPDQGFRAGRVRNLAAKQATGDLLVFLDGDCLIPPGFLKRAVRLSQPGVLLAGNRCLLDPGQTAKWLMQPTEFRDNFRQWVHEKGMGKLRSFPVGPLRDLRPRNWKAVRSCNMTMMRSDFKRIGGFDESYQGWGKEDSDLAVRAINAGLRVRLGQFATTVMHLHHTEAARDQLNRNETKLLKVIEQRVIQPQQSLWTEKK